MGPSANRSHKEEQPSKEGVKDDTGKLRMDLVPAYPLMRLAECYTIGARRYADRNWEKGLKYSRVFAAMLRHVWKWWAGEKFDPDGQHHLASVAWGAFALMEYEVTHPELDDRPQGATHNDLKANLPTITTVLPSSSGLGASASQLYAGITSPYRSGGAVGL